MSKILKVACEIWTRCVGYYRPVSQMNKGKQEEVRQRKEYKMAKEEDHVRTKSDD